MNRREIEIERHLATPYQNGETVLVRGLGIQNKNDFGRSLKIKEVLEDGVILEDGSKKDFNDIKKCTSNIGHNPFERKLVVPRPISFGIESILSSTLRETDYVNKHGIEIKSMNWNPFVLIDGKKHYYQRDFVWNLEQKQSLIDSIYNGLDCGKIVVIKRDFSEVDDEVDPELCYFNEIVDGKQRLSTILDFVNDVFPDSNGYYFGELSKIAQREFESKQCIGYAEFRGYVAPEDIISQFLKINHTGVPQSPEHINYVKEILNTLTRDEEV